MIKLNINVYLLIGEDKRSRFFGVTLSFKHSVVHAVKCLGWPCPTTFNFAFRDTNRDTLSPCGPETRDVAGRVSGRKRV